MACAETEQEGTTTSATTVPVTIETVQEGIAPPATMELATIESVQEALTSPAGPAPTKVGHSPTMTCSGPNDWEAMKRWPWDSHAPATTSPTTHAVLTSALTRSRPIKSVQEETTLLVSHPLIDHDAHDHRVCAGAHGDSGRPHPDTVCSRSNEYAGMAP